MSTRMTKIQVSSVVCREIFKVSDIPGSIPAARTMKEISATPVTP